MNQTNLIGRLAKEIELRKAEGDLSIATFTIAIDDWHAKTDRVDFIKIRCFGSLADRAKKYLRKGFLIGVDGRIHTEHYKRDGETHVKVFEIIAENLHFLQWPSNDDVA